MSAKPMRPAQGLEDRQTRVQAQCSLAQGLGEAPLPLFGSRLRRLHNA
jgi:hypothetical protein